MHDDTPGADGLSTRDRAAVQVARALRDLRRQYGYASPTADADRIITLLADKAGIDPVTAAQTCRTCQHWIHTGIYSDGSWGECAALSRYETTAAFAVRLPRHAVTEPGMRGESGKPYRFATQETFFCAEYRRKP